MKRTVVVAYGAGPVEGAVEVLYGALAGMRIAQGRGSVRESAFAIRSKGPCRLELTVDAPALRPGPESAVVTMRTQRDPFSFFLRDVNARFPVLIPRYGVAVTTARDKRPYAEIEEAVRALSLRTKMEQIDREAEETYADAAAHTRSLTCPTWLGLSRDVRIFEVGFEGNGESWSYVMPRFHGARVTPDDAKEQPVRYNFSIGRGVGCTRDVTRRIEDGVLPILHAQIVDEDVTYDCTTFATLEAGKLTARTLRGTHFLVADGFGVGHMFTPEQQAEHDALEPGEMGRPEEVVLWYRIEAANMTGAPRYAWFKAPVMAVGHGWAPREGAARSYDPAGGFGIYGADLVYCVMRLDGKPLPQEETAVLLQPGECCTFEFCIPHRPIPRERAARLAAQDFDARHAECRAFWRAKLKTAARLRLPEERLDEMARAGLLHLDLVAYGLEPQGSVAATIGVYCPIGSESSPIIQFMDSMGWHDLARRALTYFLDKQHADGFIQNFGNYMLETGAALWSMGEHWRYTRDDAWVRSIEDKLVKSCDYLIAWRNRNLTEALRGRGYGMLDGKVADPEDPYHIFMLNGYAYLGLARVAEMLRKTDPAQSRRLAAEAQALRADIRTALLDGMVRSPVIPLSDGTWSPSAPPWTEARGPVALFVDRGSWFTHGTITARDSMLGPAYLILQEVVEPEEPAADALVACCAELWHQRNVAFSQPYYSPHAYAHARRGEVKPFLKTYYNAFASLADRQTYTFWEHYFHASPHKTHEEGWFLMQTRWMLWLEDGDTLRLLPAAPRAWLASGRRIELEDVATHFGHLTLRVESRLDKDGTIRATIERGSGPRPKTIELRLPHPDGRKAVAVTGGRYDAEREVVRIGGARTEVTVIARF